ncbi:Hypothetical predicted protein [Cloeon dipterum]|uniref:Uncharacterized protein n=1 Tax=Cloeon dipterum TaxID=197152 RepID=A0A8S1E4N0_9INSE|nr:Hypothetical predicted protein [Cloeon dipterum]
MLRGGQRSSCVYQLPDAAHHLSNSPILRYRLQQLHIAHCFRGSLRGFLRPHSPPPDSFPHSAAPQVPVVPLLMHDRLFGRASSPEPAAPRWSAPSFSPQRRSTGSTAALPRPTWSSPEPLLRLVDPLRPSPWSSGPSSLLQPSFSPPHLQSSPSRVVQVLQIHSGPWESSSFY